METETTQSVSIVNRMTTFPVRFDPSSWLGPRSAQYPNSSDAFQQLVGDALREHFGSRASISPTEGRDGSIDAFIDEGQSNSRALADLPAPQIIECKDHDGTRGSYLVNIAAGWAKVEDKLRKQAAAGWIGHFQPWRRAKSYIYCVSAVLPNQSERDKLHQNIVQFFETLPAAQRPPLKAIRVLDWADLRDLFDRLPRVADRWIGTGLSLISSHAEYAASLTRFRRYLLEDNLPFVEPGPEARSRPQYVLEQLQARARTGGVVLKGIGGVGKSRTSLEVALLADAAGWRVLHVLPGEPGITVEDLSSVIFPGSAPTLLIFDYLDQMPKLDLGSVRHRLLPEAERRGVQLALLANLRPSSLRRPNAERDALFTEDILIQPTIEQKSSITELALERIAPLAVEQLGSHRVRDLCGERPIIAMFVAEELQRRAGQGTLTQTSLNGLRSGDLLGWLRRRLVEDRLVVEASSDFLPPQPEASLVSAAAILAAAPMSSEGLVEAGGAAWQAARGDGSPMAGRVLEGLISLGWLEPQDTELVAAHDVVADEVLSQVLWDRASGSLRDQVLTMCLAPALNRARVLGRYALALTRLLGSEASETEMEMVLREQASVWLSRHGSRLGQMLARADVSEAAYALGGMVSAPAWVDVCVAEWNHLIAPWLANHGTHAEARHLLYRGLKELPVDAASDLLLAALRWLPIHLSNDSASYVVSPLLARSDLGDHATPAINLAMAWLDKHPLILDTQFVLNPLLARSDLGDHATPAINLAMAWLDKHPLILDAQFVVNPLLARSDLGDHATPAINVAMAWLKKHSRIPDAEFVLKRLFGLSGLSVAQRERCVTLALPQLDRLGSAPEASFLLRGCLRDRALDPESARSVVQYGLAWIRANPQAEEADYVFNRLLRRRDLSHTDWKEVSDIGLTWLRQYTSHDNRDLSLAALLVHPEYLKEQDLEWVIREAEKWLANPLVPARFQGKLRAALDRMNAQGDPTSTMGYSSFIRMKVEEILIPAVRGRAEMPSPQELEEVVNCMAIALDDSRPSLAAFPLPTLLALISPATHPELWARLIALARRILGHPEFPPRHRQIVTREIWLLVDGGAWLEDFARPILDDLGLLRPMGGTRK